MMVKICGLTREEDVEVSAEAGADLLGFVFAESPRQVSADQVRKMRESLPKGITTVGVFVNESLERVLELVDHCGLDLVQLHGDESPSYCARLRGRAIKAMRVRDEIDSPCLASFAPLVWAVLLDTYLPDRRGGTGRAFDWTVARDMDAGTRLFIAGGLRPSNVAEAVRATRPDGVDVSSGVEREKGMKDAAKVKEFVKNARGDVSATG